MNVGGHGNARRYAGYGNSSSHAAKRQRTKWLLLLLRLLINVYNPALLLLMFSRILSARLCFDPAVPHLRGPALLLSPYIML